MTTTTTPLPHLHNRMHEATSPYLKQHTDNPVHWQPWGDEAFAAARMHDVPVLLSIGYAACHWCHVMAHESFEDDGIAAYLNAHYVCIKVDREERPDVDAVYMAVTTALNEGRGGWPMTVLLNADKAPFFAGTYFPPRARAGHAGFYELLQQVTHLWQTDRPRLSSMAQDITAAVQQDTPPKAGALPTNDATELLCQAAQTTLATRYDAIEGGYTRAPKFPHTDILRFLLWRGHHTQDAAIQEPLQHTLCQMARGGLYDVVGGGFSRYSVDAAWHVPHFEKMLYDNALLATTYAEACMASPAMAPSFAHVAQSTLDFVLRELTHADGTFYASLDADSEGHEGSFYVWRHADALAVLNAQQTHTEEDNLELLRRLGITEEGSWEHGVSIPRLHDELPVQHADFKPAIDVLFAARAERVRPATDDKIITGHNGLMLRALATGCRAFGRPAYLQAAARTADALWKKSVTPEGALMRLPITAHGPKILGLLEDHAYLADGLVALYEAGADAVYLERAHLLCHAIVKLFADADSGVLYDTSPSHEALLFRPKESHDGATPSAWATAAQTLVRVARLTGDGGLQAAGEAALGAMVDDIRRMPHAYGTALMALELCRHEGTEAAFVSDASPWQGADTALFASLAGTYAPHRVLAHGTGVETALPCPQLLHRSAKDGVPTVYLCARHTCAPPVTEVRQLQALQQAP